MKKKFLALLLVPALAISLTMTACNMSQFEAVLNEIGPAIATILQIIAIVKGTPANTTLASKVSADVAGVEKLYNDFESADAASAPGIRADLQAGFTTLNGDISTIFNIAQVSDPNTQAKITALINLTETAVQIAEAAVPPAPGPAPAKVSAAKTAAIYMSAKQLKSSFNSILVARTGNSQLDAWTAKHKI
jgi:hypothetical protein